MTSYLKLLRIPLLLCIALSQLIIHFVITPHVIMFNGFHAPALILTLIILSTVVIAASGFVINDYYDMRIDEINHPLTRVVGNEIGKKETMNLYVALFALSIILSAAIALITRNMLSGFIFVTVVGLLWFYSSSYKRALFGNIIVAIAVALIPFTMALLDGTYIMQSYMERLIANNVTVTDENLSVVTPFIQKNYLTVGYYSLFVFVGTLVHEVVRNLYEEKGEREMECHTIPIVYGNNTAKYVIYAILALLNTTCIAILATNFDDLKMISASYYLCTVFAFSIGLIMFLKNAEHAKDYKSCLLFAKLIICSGIGYGFVYAYLNPIEAA